MPPDHPTAPIHGRKRKPSLLEEMQESSASQSRSTRQQSAITDHFSPRSQASAVFPPSTSRAKRSKPSSADGREDKPVTEATMLDFGTKDTLVDLTASSPPAMEISDNSNMTTGKVSAGQKPTGAKRLQIRNLKKPMKNSADGYFNTTWQKLDTALAAIFNKERITYSLEELYRSVENVCRGGKAPEMFELLKECCDRYVAGSLRNMILHQVGGDVVQVVRIVDSAWNQWQKQLSTIREVFLYLDRSYLFSSTSRQSIKLTGISMFRKHIIENRSLEKRLQNGVFELFKQDRQSGGEDSINTTLLKSYMTMISDLGLYSWFEPDFIQDSRSYYKQLAERESLAESPIAYIRECALQIEKETMRCEKFSLEVSTKRQLLSVLDEEIIKQKIPLLTDSARIRVLLERFDTTTLRILYQLLERVGDPGEALKPSWEVYIKTEGLKILLDKEKESDMVPRLMDFQGTLTTIWHSSFFKNSTIEYSLRESFTSFINYRQPGATIKDQSKAAEMIAKYVDLILRHGTKGLPPVSGSEVALTGTDDDACLAHRLELVLNLFRFIQGKAIFEAFYKKDLARRLLLARSASFDAERLMLTKLKNECGAGFTNNLEAMFKDMDLSRESVSSFKSSKIGITAAEKYGVELHVNVLSQAAWPSYPEVPVQLPRELGEHLETFGVFYTGKHKGHVLSWRHALSHCVLKAEFAKGRKYLILSAFQAVVLLSFNSSPPSVVLTYTDLLSATSLPPAELKRTLQSLALGKQRVLLKSPRGREITDNDKFQINQAFSSPNVRVKINQIQHRETEKENTETHEAVERDRGFETQAAIIRVMKSRKNVRHTELVQAVIEQTAKRGALDVSGVKVQIEKLIEKDYMKRGEGDTYLYVA
ncbi:Cullin family-domain-containing protein [Pyronema domesticum]|nr:Cullin family-domain-containing protein [Pyronema domesticum]